MAQLVRIYGPNGGVGLYNEEQAREVLKRSGFSTTKPEEPKKDKENDDEDDK